MPGTSIKQLSFMLTLSTLCTGFFSAAVFASGKGAARARPTSDTGQNEQRTLSEVQALNKQLIDSENSKDFTTVSGMVWDSPSALFVAKTATAAEGNWAGFWGHDVVVQHLHDVLFGGPFHIEPDYSKAKAAILGSDVAETYVPVLITVGYAGQTAIPKPFLLLVDWIKTPKGWKMASDIAIPVPAPPSQSE
jgi:hypothetical protein